MTTKKKASVWWTPRQPYMNISKTSLRLIKKFRGGGGAEAEAKQKRSETEAGAKEANTSNDRVLS